MKWRFNYELNSERKKQKYKNNLGGLLILAGKKQKKLWSYVTITPNWHLIIYAKTNHATKRKTAASR
jgi:hypothetical protein